MVEPVASEIGQRSALVDGAAELASRTPATAGGRRLRLPGAVSHRAPPINCNAFANLYRKHARRGPRGLADTRSIPRDARGPVRSFSAPRLHNL
jgi:hypothetical protein